MTSFLTPLFPHSPHPTHQHILSAPPSKYIQNVTSSHPTTSTLVQTPLPPPDCQHLLMGLTLSAPPIIYFQLKELAGDSETPENATVWHHCYCRSSGFTLTPAQGHGAVSLARPKLSRNWPFSSKDYICTHHFSRVHQTLWPFYV